MDTKVAAPPAQYDVERQFRDLLKHGDIDDLATWLDEPYDTLNPKLNPNRPQAKSDFYKAARLLWALRMMRDELAWDALNLLAETVFPGESKLHVLNRIESDIRKLKEDVSAEGGGEGKRMRRAS